MLRPTGPILVDAAMRKGFLEYRSLLRTNFVESSLAERMFQLAVEVLLARIPVPWEAPPDSGRVLEGCSHACHTLPSGYEAR